jgi:glutathione S-transferase
MIVLHGVPVSTYTAKVRIALHAKGLAFTEREPEGGYRGAAWRARVPTGTIPALEVDGVLLAESEAIVEYLEEAHPAHPLLPGTPLQRAHARFLARYHDLHLEPRVRALFPLVRDGARTAAQVQAAAGAVQERLDTLATLARPAPFLAGPTLTVADLGHAVSVPMALRLLALLGAPLAVPPALQAWLQAAQAHPAVAAGLAPWRPATEHWLSTAFVPSPPP